jgi:hypothetical protein
MNLPKTQEQSKAWVTLLVGLVVVVLAIIFFKKIMDFFNGIGEGLGLKDTKEEKVNRATVAAAVNKENAKGNKSYWSPNFYIVSKPPNKLTASTAESIAKQFYDSVGYVTDTPSQGAGALRRCANGCQLSQVAATFNSKYGLDLLNWLQNKYDTQEQVEILADMLRYSNNLPKWN